MKKTKKALAIFLAMVMILGATPAMAFAYYLDEVDYVEISDVHKPVIDETPNFYYDIPYDSGYWCHYDNDGDCCAWVETDFFPETWDDLDYGTWAYKSGYEGIEFTFQEGKYYTFVAFLIEDDSFVFSDDLCACVNEEWASVEYGDDGIIAVWCTYEASTRIYVIEVDGVTAPVISEDADFYWESPEDDGYHIRYDNDGDCCAWVETDFLPETWDDLDYGIWAYESGYEGIEITFQEGKYYTFVMFVEADYGYFFSEYDLYAKFNGEMFDANTQLIDYNEAAVWKTFSAEDDYGYGEIYEIDSLDETTISYKGFELIGTLIYSNGDPDYTIEYRSLDNSVCVVDEDGGIYGVGTGTTSIIITVTDSHGNVFEDATEVTVKYTFWQWIIVILFFGWIWY